MEFFLTGAVHSNCLGRIIDRIESTCQKKTNITIYVKFNLMKE